MDVSGTLNKIRLASDRTVLPGVYYNFICRLIIIDQTLEEQNKK